MTWLVRAVMRRMFRMTGQVMLKSFDEDDLETLKAWRLTDEGIARFDQAVTAAEAAARREGSVSHTYRPRGPSRRRTLAALEQDVQASARLRNAIEAAGLSVRDFVLTREALLQSLTVHAMTLGDLSAVPEEASADNVRFVAARQDALQALGARWQHLDAGST